MFSCNALIFEFNIIHSVHYRINNSTVTNEMHSMLMCNSKFQNTISPLIWLFPIILLTVFRLLFYTILLWCSHSDGHFFPC